MTSRKPPSQRDPQYAIVRYGRALQSMSPGSMGGRVANASPVSFRSASAAPLVTAPGGGGVGRPADKGTPSVVIDYPDATDSNANYLEGNHTALIGDVVNAASSDSFIFGRNCQVGYKGDYDTFNTVDEIYVFGDGASIGLGVDPTYFNGPDLNDPIYPRPDSFGSFTSWTVPPTFQRFGGQSDMIVMGDGPTVDGSDMIVMGDGPCAFGHDIICVGDGPVAGGNRFISESWFGYIPGDLIAIGDGPSAYGFDGIAIGDGPSAGTQRSQRDPDAGGTITSYDNVAIGDSSSAGSAFFNFNYDGHVDGGGSQNVAIGGSAGAGQNQRYPWSTDGNVAIGEYSNASGEGLQADYYAGHATAIGWDAYVLANAALGIGKDPYIGEGSTRAIAVGSEVYSYSADTTIVGSNAQGGNQLSPVNDDDSPVTTPGVRAADVRHSTALGAQSWVTDPFRVKLGSEIDTVEVPRQLAMTSPNGSKFVLSIDNTGAVVSAPLVPYTIIDTFHKRDTVTVPISYPPFSTSGIRQLDGYKGLGTANPTLKLIGSEAGPVWQDAFGATLADKWEIIHGKARRYDHVVDAATAFTDDFNYGITRPFITHTGPNQHVAIYVYPSERNARSQGLFFRLSADGLNGYLATIQGANLTLFSVAGATPTQLAQVVPQYDMPGSALSDGSNVLECVATGTSIQVWLNGVKRIDVTDATYATGNCVGLFSMTPAHSFDWRGDAGFFDMLMDMSSGNVFPKDYSGMYGGAEAPSLYKIFRRAPFTTLDTAENIHVKLHGRAYGLGSNMTDELADVTWRYFQNGTFVVDSGNLGGDSVHVEWFSSATGAWNDPGGLTLVASHTSFILYNSGLPAYYNVTLPLSGPKTNGTSAKPALVRITHVSTSTVIGEIRWPAYT